VVLESSPQQGQQRLAFVPMQEADIDAILAVEERIYPFPWSRGNFLDSLAAGYSAWVCRAADDMIGYAVLMLVLDEAHLLNISVVPERQRCGLGSVMLEHIFAVARSHGAVRMLLEVRPSNLSGLALYARFGFAQVGRRRGYYARYEGREDALVMARNL
jgi:ribosomal-protein-alanine N-acetyltransferase